ncbi:MAG TPA: efflux RND transporter periplasmic adaptor subunit [Bacteroidales bacterium]|nr:efflux RND transporter periplasmic adaptor subunit [Bacteroidales bacterium]HRR92447.1 efflux RND transporter periplasmic adaptor subunit [Bacteroidales bacterium]HRT90173.1 efflux RND transporter periplasmic adaptor subunit [Bacteroidales bacterium]
MKKTLIISGIAVVIVVAALIIIGRVSKKSDISVLYGEAKKGQFDIIVYTTGELQAENSLDIRGPEIAQSRNIRSMEIKIQDLVPEGTLVKEGDYVATLDRTSFDNTLKDEMERLATYETNLETAMLDTAVTLTNLRDNIKNLTYSVEEARITLEQSKYEPPATIRQAEINLDKAERSLEQAKRSYNLRVEQTRANILNTRRQLNEQRQKVADLQKLLSSFIIKAPADGMVIYKRDRTGAKRKTGSSISPFDNAIATLPDMSSMISKTYVNEIDVSKVKAGQKVDIIVDAFPDKSYTGSVISVANIGEQLPNADAKVFEVLIKVDGSDPILRPAMTTGNKIVTKTINDVIYVPLECVQTGQDSIPFVYTKSGKKQIVLLGESNENDVVVEKGIEPGTLLYLSTPEKPEKFSLAGEELIPLIRERERLKQEEERRIREEAARAAERRQRMMGGGAAGMRGQFQNFGGGNFPGGGNFQGGAGMMPGGAGVRDTAAMRRRMEEFRNSQGGAGGMRDTSARRRMNTQRMQEGGNNM